MVEVDCNTRKAKQYSLDESGAIKTNEEDDPIIVEYPNEIRVEIDLDLYSNICQQNGQLFKIAEKEFNNNDNLVLRVNTDEKI